MAMAERSATTEWDGDLAHGSGEVSVGSGAFATFPVTWASRTERSDGKTSPEELIAAAHSSCFSMALSHGLTEAGHKPEHLSVSAKVTLDQRDGAPTVTTSELAVTGRVPGIDQAVVHGLVGLEEAVALHVGVHLLHRLTGVVGVDLVDPVADVEDLASVDLDVGRLALEAGGRLVNQDAAVG